MTEKEVIEQMYQQDRKQARRNYIEAVTEARRLREMRLDNLQKDSKKEQPGCDA
ncbi:hypothetical protein AB9K35_17785 [Leisingera sp. XS_AS12]|uniref:hypothetical protein n=1 Tax=Leisingera TaxID=191028 RepID=UPI000425623A|nr:hypothetical protein [Leisingera caerulea]